MLKFLLTLCIVLGITCNSWAEGTKPSLSGNYYRDLRVLKNCQVIEGLLNMNMTRELTRYEKSLAMVIVPWYHQNCSKA